MSAIPAAAATIADVQPPQSGPAPRGRLASLKRALAMLLLPASILPVPLLGPGLLHAPQRLMRQAHAELQRLQESSR